jgi:hypothetical protein
MARSVVFDTPGSIELRALTSIGVNTKPNSTNPIGTFGTGLKYSVAVLARLGLGMSVVVDGAVYAFYRKTERFRDADFDFIRMKKETLQRTLSSRAQYSELAYTTQYGKFWQLWQVYRELHSNTLDENGRTYVVDSIEDIEFLPGRTYIVVTGEAFAQEYDNRDKTFLPDGATAVHASERLQVLDRPSKYVYYRGMRVYDLDKPAQFTYNFLRDVELTEDRTAKNSMLLRTYIEQHMLASSNSDMVRRAVNAPGDTFESDLSYTYHSSEPTQEFIAAASAGPLANPTAASYVRGKTLRQQHGQPLDGRPRPWRIEGSYIVDADGDPVLQHSFGGGLEPIQLRYVLALLNRDIYGWELDNFIASEVNPEDAKLLADVPF